MCLCFWAAIRPPARCRAQHPELHSLRYYAVGDEVPLGRFVRTHLRQLVQELLKSGPKFPVLAEGQRLHPAQLVELPLLLLALPTGLAGDHSG
jgi:hypothetical protein